MPEKLRLLLAIGEFSGGGSQRQMIGILQRLDRTRFQPYLYLVSPGGDLLPEVPADVPVFTFAERNRQTGWWYPGQAHAARVRDLTEVLRQERIDIVYDRTYHMTLITAPAARQTQTARLSVIVADPNLDIDTNRERFRPIKRRLLTQAYRTADRVLAVSDGVRQAAIDYYALQSDQVTTLYNFFDIERIDRRMSESLPTAEQKQVGRFEIVAAGRLHPQKGFADLLAAVRDLVHDRGRKQIHLRILGTGSLEDELRSYIVQHQLESHVTLAGFHENPLPFFRQADLFCLPSLYEGMPNALVEAMLCRVPVLAADCPSGPREILQDGRLGRLSPPANPRALADAIDDAILHPETWQRLVPAARAHIEQQFSPQSGIQALESLFTDIAAKHRQILTQRHKGTEESIS
jgi:glycosyltransferase involved in cell wall biosynthesis